MAVATNKVVVSSLPPTFEDVSLTCTDLFLIGCRSHWKCVESSFLSLFQSVAAAVAACHDYVESDDDHLTLNIMKEFPTKAVKPALVAIPEALHLISDSMSDAELDTYILHSGNPGRICTPTRVPLTIRPLMC